MTKEFGILKDSRMANTTTMDGKKSLISTCLCYILFLDANLEVSQRLGIHLKCFGIVNW